MMLVLESLDGAGKNTQIDLLIRKIPNIAVFKYPTKNTPELKKYLNNKLNLTGKEIFDLFLKDIQNEQDKIQEALNQGKLVILDRYIFSTIAYEKQGVSYSEAKEIVKKINFIKPDKVLFLNISPELSQERKRKQKKLDKYEANKEYLEKVKTNFFKLFREKFLCKNWIKIDASKSADKVHEDILKYIK